jgi:multiple sugar transport system substrate-binding protein
MKRQSRFTRAVLTAVVGGLSGVLVFAGCSGSAPGTSSGQITVAGYKDTGHHLHDIINAWNAAHPAQKARYVELPESSDQQRQQLVQNFQARSSTYDVVIADDTWTSEFASKKWLAPLPKAQFPLDQVFSASVNAGTYQGQLYTMPYTANADLFYYRSDLVAKPPTTWAQLVADCAVAKKHNIGCYAGQYAQYEGLTVNFTSAVASAGGRVLSADGTRAQVDSPQGKKALNFLVNGFRQGYIPKEAITYQEEESRRAFQQGKLLFLMNYPYVYPQANTKGPDSKVAGKFKVTTLPGLTGPGVSTTGGHMMGVSAFSKHRATAVDFVKFFTSEANARKLLVSQGTAPVYKDLYADAQLVKQYPFLPVLQRSLDTGVPRPKTVNYAALSLAIQQNVYPALQGNKSTDAALADMTKQLDEAIKGH